MLAFLLRCASPLSTPLLRTAIRRTLGRAVPFAKLLGLRVTRIEDAEADVQLSAVRSVLNHVGTLHAGAIYTACETASGAAIADLFRFDLPQLRFVVRDAQIKYVRAAVGDMTATAVVLGNLDELIRNLHATGRVDVTVRATGTGDCDGILAPVAEASFIWSLRLSSKNSRGDANRAAA